MNKPRSTVYFAYLESLPITSVDSHELGVLSAVRSSPQQSASLCHVARNVANQVPGNVANQVSSTAMGLIALAVVAVAIIATLLLVQRLRRAKAIGFLHPYW